MRCVKDQSGHHELALVSLGSLLTLAWMAEAEEVRQPLVGRASLPPQTLPNELALQSHAVFHR